MNTLYKSASLLSTYIWKIYCSQEMQELYRLNRNK